jgi:hypothetical protein
VLGGAAQDAEEHGKAEFHGPQDRSRAAAGPEPHPQRLLGPGHDHRVDEGLVPVGAAPAHPVLAVQRQQQVELRAVQCVVVAYVQIEEREGDVRGSASGHDVDAAGGNRRRHRQLLEHPDRFVGGQDRDGGAEADPVGGRRGGVDKRRGRRHGHRGGVVLAEAEEVEADLFGDMDRL